MPINSSASPLLIGRLSSVAFSLSLSLRAGAAATSAERLFFHFVAFARNQAVEFVVIGGIIGRRLRGFCRFGFRIMRTLRFGRRRRDGFAFAADDGMQRIVGRLFCLGFGGGLAAFFFFGFGAFRLLFFGFAVFGVAGFVFGAVFSFFCFVLVFVFAGVLVVFFVFVCGFAFGVWGFVGFFVGSGFGCFFWRRPYRIFCRFSFRPAWPRFWRASWRAPPRPWRAVPAGRAGSRPCRIVV